MTNEPAITGIGAPVNQDLARAGDTNIPVFTI